MSPKSDAISEFWRFWHENRAAIEEAIHDGTLKSWAKPLGRLVHEIDPDLDWEMGAGRHAEHYFCVSSKGDSTKRLTTERWRAYGPGDDAVFEFHAARPGGGYSPALEMRFGDATFAAADYRFGFDVDAARRHVHIAAWHPTFAQVETRLARIATFVMLDAVFGEDDVERWIGGVDFAEVPPPDPVDFQGLVVAVDVIRETPETFTLLKGQLTGGEPVFITANLSVKRMDHLMMDMHIEVVLTLRSPTEQGLTTNAEAEELNEAEDRLLEALGRDAVNIGRETRTGLRVLHFHVAQGGPAIACVDAWAAELAWPCEVRAHQDPQWDVLRRW